MRFAPLLALAGCLHVPSGWTVVNATSEQEAQAQALVTAIRAVTGAEMPHGVITLETRPYGLDGKCGTTTAHVSGCSYSATDLVVLVMPPLLGPDLYSTALAHELAHAVGAESEEETSEVAGKIARMAVCLERAW